MRRIHLLTPISSKGFRTLADIAHLSSPEVGFTHSELDRGPPSIECEYDEAFAVPDTIVKAIEAERDGADAIVIDCMGDPGLKPAREAVSIPVVGAAEAAMHLAAMMGHKFSIVTVLDSVKPMLSNLARSYGVYDRLASILVVDTPVLELEVRYAEVQQRLAEASATAVERDGAHVIVLGCTGFLGCAEAIKTHLESRGLAVPVIDPIPAAVCLADAMVKVRLTHSKRTYAPPRAKEMVGFDLS